jgi:hypothetical protein
VTTKKKVLKHWYVSVRVQHYVLCLEVSVDDVVAMEVLEGADDLAEVELGHVLRHHPLHLHPAKQLAPVAEFLKKFEKCQFSSSSN